MAIVEPASGTTIDKSDITTMHEGLRVKLNGAAGGIVASDLARHSLGPQHLPDAIVGWLAADITAAQTVTAANPADVQAETTGDIETNWNSLAGYTQNNGGAGWTLPPCKVLFWFTCDVSTYSISLDNDTQLWVAVHFVRDGATNETDLTWSGMVHGSEQKVNCDGAYAATSPSEINEPISIMGVLDRTSAGGNWVLNSMGVKAAIARGDSGAMGAHDVVINRGSIGFIAIYKDE